MTVEIECAINGATCTVPLRDSLTCPLKYLVVVSHELGTPTIRNINLQQPHVMVKLSLFVMMHVMVKLSLFVMMLVPIYHANKLIELFTREPRIISGYVYNINW